MDSKENELEQNKVIGQRLKAIRKAKKMTAEEFYGPLMNKSFSNGLAMEGGKRKLGTKTARELIAYYHINEEYLDTGEGEMFKVNPHTTWRSGEPASEEEEVPYYNVNLVDVDFDSANVFRDEPEFYVRFRPFNDCNAYLPIYGDSMYPRFASGEIIAIKEVGNYDIIQWGEAYLVVTDERANGMATVKLLFEHPDSDKLILRASNPNYVGDTIISKKHISKLYIVKGKITRNQL